MSPNKQQRRSFTYSIPCLVEHSKRLKESGMLILRTKQNHLPQDRKRVSISTSEPSVENKMNSKFLPYIYAQRLNIVNTVNLIFQRKAAEIDLCVGSGLEKPRSYTECII